MDPAFLRGYQARVKRYPFVFRHQLIPLTLGHLFLLEAIESPIIADRGEITLADIGAAVFICSHNHDKSAKKLNGWFFPIYARIWARYARAEWMLVDWPIFREYLSDGLRSPMLRPARRDGATTASCSAPGPWVKLMFAMHVLHMTREQAMETEVAELNTLYATFAAWSGSGELGDSSVIDDLWAFAREQDAKKFNADGTRKQQEAC